MTNTPEQPAPETDVPEMVERVARAMCFALAGRYCGGDGCQHTCEAPWRNHVHMERDEMARAAIEAMREPTTTMINAGMRHQGVDLAAEYRAMIDAALGKDSTDD